MSGAASVWSALQKWVATEHEDDFHREFVVTACEKHVHFRLIRYLPNEHPSDMVALIFGTEVASRVGTRRVMQDFQITNNEMACVADVSLHVRLAARELDRKVTEGAKE